MGWEVLAWMIMDNHYHWLLRTPKPNLVEGMSWLPEVALRRRLWRMSESGGLRLLTCCVMGNHFHALVQVPVKEEWMRQFEGSDGEKRRYRPEHGGLVSKCG